MAVIINMPRLSDTMEEGVVAKWLKKVGDTVNEGDILAEIETDKATMEFESFNEGTLLYIGINEGETSKVDTLLAIIGEKDEDISDLLKSAKEAPKTEEKEADPAKTVNIKEENKSSTAANIPDGAEIITMPRLSDTMTEGTVATWLKKEGDVVKEGDILAEIETDKATMEFESFYEGTLLYIGVNEGETAEVDSVLAVIGNKGTDVSGLVASIKDGAFSKTDDKKEEPKSAPQQVQETESAPTQEANVTTSATGGRIFASPLAKKIAQEKGINLAQVPNSQMRKVIARRLGESKFTAPHYYLNVEFNMDNAIAFRQQFNSVPDTKISYNDMVVKAVALALKEHPQVNSQWFDDKMRINHHVHIGVAVAVEDGLLVPVLKFADEQSLQQIGAKVKDYAGKARSKKLTPQEMEGSTFTISNLGMFGITDFTSIINQPNSAILSVGAIVQKPIVKEGQIVVGNTMKLTLACDHRTVDGATGAEFLLTLKGFIENPVTMLV